VLSQRLSFERIRPIATRAIVLVVLVVGLIALGRSETLHRELIGVLDAAKAVMAAHPVGGAVLFLLLSALAAMLGFVSSAVLVPAAVYTWGPAFTMLMLWIGWTIGGLFAYTLAFAFGRPILSWALGVKQLRRYQHFLSKRPTFLSVLLFQLALPSEIPGYLLGLARYPLFKYLAALMIAELPYAVGTVLLGQGFVERDTAMLVIVCVIGAVALIVLAQLLKRQRENDEV
jgi:uncharacterized membrane protein YdjX (TVP38/TMEM64 family)